MAEAPAKQSVFRSFTNGIVKTTCVIGGLYVVRGYMRDRLEEVRVKMETDERAREVLRTRFLQTQEDTSYTILALLPTLSSQVLSNMDVDALTRELQARSMARNSRHLEGTKVAQTQVGFVNTNINTTSTPRSPSSLSSSIDLLSTSVSAAPITGSGSTSFASVSASSYPPNPYPAPATHEPDADSRSDLDSISHSSEAEDAHSPATGISSSFISDAGSVTRSWIVESDGPSASGASASGASGPQERPRSPAVSAVSSMDHSESSSVDADGGHRMSESVVSITTNTTTTTNTSAEGSEINVNDTRTKAELWNEVKMLTFTRTLTTLYASTLLCLLTTLQLTLLARGKYVAAVLAQEKEERRRERIMARSSLASVGMELGGMLVRTAAERLGFGGDKQQDGGLGALEKLLAAFEEEDDQEDEFMDEEFREQRQPSADDQDEADHEEGWGLGWRSAVGKEKRSGRPPRHGKGKEPAPTQTHGLSATPTPAPENAFGRGSASGNGKSKAPWPGPISEEAESKYLTMSWWLLHVGWKDVGERVRRGVEEVFDGVSLKTKLAAVDLHRLVGDVRRRVEHEITFEGNEKRTNFLSSLLPPTPETIHHVLTQGGYTSSAAAGASWQGASSLFAYPDPLGQFLDLGAGADVDVQSHSQSQSEHQHQHQHERMPSISSTSLESSQLSYNFVNSPALAVSSAHPPHTHTQQQPLTQQQQQQQAQTQTYLPAPPPQPPSPELLDAPFLALLDETREILASPDFAAVLEACLDKATAVLFDGLEANVFSRQGKEEDERIRLAGLLPGLARWSQLALDGLPNELVDIILGMREVSCISAIAFARFEERFSP